MILESCMTEFECDDGCVLNILYTKNIKYILLNVNVNCKKELNKRNKFVIKPIYNLFLVNRDSSSCIICMMILK